MGQKHQEGFTLIELLVLMMVFALTLGMGVPAFTSIVANTRMSTAGNDLVSSLHAARAEATTRNRSVTLCASSDWDAAEPGCDASAAVLDGWIVFVDGNSDGAVNEGETVLQGHGPVADTIRSHDGSAADAGPPQYLSFRGDGFPQEFTGIGAPVRNIQLCDARGDVSTGKDADGEELAAGRWIAIGATGRPRMHRLRADVQGNGLGGC